MTYLPIKKTRITWYVLSDQVICSSQRTTVPRMGNLMALLLSLIALLLADVLHHHCQCLYCHIHCHCSYNSCLVSSLWSVHGEFFCCLGTWALSQLVSLCLLSYAFKFPIQLKPQNGFFHSFFLFQLWFILPCFGGCNASVLSTSLSYQKYATNHFKFKLWGLFIIL